MLDHPNAGRELTLDPRELARYLSGKYIIDGRLHVSEQGFEVRSPATGELVAQAAECTKQEVDAAVASASKAQRAWSRISARERGKLVAECGRLLSAHVEELGRLVALETGKALRTESRVEASVVSDMFNFFGGLGSELKGETVPFRPDVLTMTVREPLGVVAAIIPWNVPMLLMAMKIAPALVAGNTVVVKSAEESPLAVLRVCELMNRILPPGVFNMLSGDGPTCGGPLASHPDVKKVTFTGSVETGKIIYRAAAEKLIPVTLELGGKSPMIVMGDADLEKAVEGALSGMRFTRQGQSCTAASRILVQAELHDSFVERLVSRVDALKMGDPLDESTDIGTIISRTQYEKVSAYVTAGEATPGATAIRCGVLPTSDTLKDGLFFRPVIFTGLTNESRLCREEIFGPVTCVLKFTTFEEAISIANDSDFGLAATIWTGDLKTALRAAGELEAGFVQVNQNLVAQPNTSYGGVKQSGLGKEATLESMLEHFTNKKTVMFNMA